MARVRRIVVSQVEGGYSNDSDKRPNGEIALYDDNNGSFDLVIHDGVNSTSDNKVLGKGKFYGHNGAVYINSSTSDNDPQWIFATAGTLTLPEGGDIVNHLGDSVLSDVGVIEVTHSEILDLIDSSGLVTDRLYEIGDFRTCYDQPDYDIYGNRITEGNYKQGNIIPIVVRAASDSTLHPYAYQQPFPNDIIKYDVLWTQTEITGGTAYGRITERIDEWNNRTDYDHREVLFKRYDWFSYNPNQPQSGTISITNGIVSGVETQFTNLSVNDIIVIPSLNETFFRISTIDSNTQMSLTGSVWDVTTSDTKYYLFDNVMNSASAKKNNVSEDFYEYTTFGDAIDNNGAWNNYIGDHANSFILDEIGDFLLSNNVFLSGVYFNNKFGNNCFNNSFNDDCTDNTIGNFFTNNITDDDFDRNQIENYFENNIITSNFQDNIIGNGFNNNIITIGSFNDNRIGHDFNENKIDSNDFYDFNRNSIGINFNNNLISVDNDDFTDNNIGNEFEFNVIKRGFFKNQIGHYFYSNSLYNRFYGNIIDTEFHNNTVGDSNNIGDADFSYNKIGYESKGNLFTGYIYENIFGNLFSVNQLSNETYGNIIGNGFQVNTFGSYFYNNIIGNYCNDNQVGDDFKENRIGNNFNNNTITYNFAYNEILNNFYNNNIENDFGYGGGQSRGNRIGNYFSNNNIGEYFYDNIIADVFDANTVGDYFQLNDIKAQYIYNYNFKEFLGNILAITDNTGASPSIPGTDGTYTLSPTGGNGEGSSFYVVVSGSIVSNVTINSGGVGYLINDTLTILGSQFGGTDGVDITITVTATSSTPVVYTQTNSTIVRDRNNNLKLHYIGTSGIEIVGITETYD